MIKVKSKGTRVIVLEQSERNIFLGMKSFQKLDTTNDFNHT